MVKGDGGADEAVQLALERAAKRAERTALLNAAGADGDDDDDGKDGTIRTLYLGIFGYSMENVKIGEYSHLYCKCLPKILGVILAGRGEGGWVPKSLRATNSISCQFLLREIPWNPVHACMHACMRDIIFFDSLDGSNHIIYIINLCAGSQRNQRSVRRLHQN